MEGCWDQVTLQQLPCPCRTAGRVACAFEVILTNETSSCTENSGSETALPVSFLPCPREAILTFLASFLLTGDLNCLRFHQGLSRSIIIEIWVLKNLCSSLPLRVCLGSGHCNITVDGGLNLPPRSQDTESWEPYPGSQGCQLSVSSYSRGDKEVSGVCFIRAQFPELRLHDLAASQSPQPADTALTFSLLQAASHSGRVAAGT